MLRPTQRTVPRCIGASALARLLALLLSMNPMPQTRAADLLLDFSDAHAIGTFRVINDAVMGGVSSSSLESVGGALRFEGTVSLERNGGFASFRGPVRIPARACALLLRVRGDGKRYKLTLKTDESNSSPQYQAPFTAPADWTTLSFAASDFAASFRGRAVDAPPLDFGAIRAIGLLISDGQAGAFRVEVRAVEAAKAAAQGEPPC